MPRVRDPLRGRAMVPRLLTALPTPRRWRYLPRLRGDDHRRRTHRKSRPELTLARGQHVHPLLKKPPRFEGKLTRRPPLWPTDLDRRRPLGAHRLTPPQQHARTSRRRPRPHHDLASAPLLGCPPADLIVSGTTHRGLCGRCPWRAAGERSGSTRAPKRWEQGVGCSCGGMHCRVDRGPYAGVARAASRRNDALRQQLTRPRRRR
jgi:hypothetical protein